MRFTVDFMRLWLHQHLKLEWVKEELAEPLKKLQEAAAVAQANVPSRRQTSRTKLLLVPAFALAVGLVIVILTLLRSNSSAAEGIARTIPVDRCQVIDVQSVFSMDWCITTAEVLKKTGHVRLNVAWSAHILKLQAGQVVLKSRLDTDSCLTDSQKCIYLEDPAGKRFNAIDLGGAAAQDSLMRDGDTVRGWVLFPSLSDARSFDFVFQEDLVRIQDLALR